MNREKSQKVKDICKEEIMADHLIKDGYKERPGKVDRYWEICISFNNLTNIYCFFIMGQTLFQKIGWGEKKKKDFGP